MKRTADFFNELIHNPAYEDKTILIATHGCALRAMLNPLYENKDSFWQERVPYNCAVTIIDAKEGQAKIASIRTEYIMMNPSVLTIIKSLVTM